MSFAFGGTQANVTITGSQAPLTVPDGATLINRSDVDTADLYTVTAGKTLYIFSAYASCSRNSVAGGQGSAHVDADLAGDGTYRKLVSACATSTATGASASANNVTFPVMVTVPAGKKVRLSKTSTPDVIACGFTGYEV